MPVVIRDLWQLKTVAFLHWCLLQAVLFDEIVQNTKICTNLLQKEFYKMSCMRRRRHGTQHNDIQHNDKKNIKKAVISKMTISTTIFSITTIGLKFSTTKLDVYAKCRCAICHLCWMSSIIPFFRVPFTRRVAKHTSLLELQSVCLLNTIFPEFCWSLVVSLAENPWSGLNYRHL
jgi:hypothetical protein